MNSEILGAYYLHTNGDLIWKPAACFQNDPEYFDSPFVKKVWYIPKEDPVENFEKLFMFMVDWLREAYELGARKERIHDICKTNNFPDIVYNAILKGKKGKQQ